MSRTAVAASAGAALAATAASGDRRRGLRRQLLHHDRRRRRDAVPETNVRLKIDSAETGPPEGVPVILGAGMQGDRVSVTFSDSSALASSIEEKC